MEPNVVLTEEIKAHAIKNDIDVFGIAAVDALNKNGRIGRRPLDLFRDAKSILVFGCGMADSLTRAWIQNVTGGDLSSIALNELEIRKLKLKQFLQRKGYRCFGGDILGGGIMEVGLRLANVCEECGIGYIGKSGLLITEKYGPRVNLLYIATDAPLIPDKKHVENRCGNCTVCQKFCTSKAIIGDGYFNPRQCESIINCKPNKLWFSKSGSLDCDMCLRMCQQGEWKWEKEECTGMWWHKLEENHKSKISELSVFRTK